MSYNFIMDLNKLTKKELVEYGESMNRFLNIRDKKEDLIASIEQIEMFEEVNDSIRRKNTGEKDSIQVRSLKKKIKHLEERRDSERINSQIRTNELINEGKEEVKSDIKTVFVIIGIFLLFAFYLSTLPSENI
ncbi:hypothetical protein N9M98_01885 [Candidatus Pseudothioglobus singularis]|nr:hypothetical protein [Candidatus Pseudothioglobus singularis]